jgi:hypothetical protein
MLGLFGSDIWGEIDYDMERLIKGNEEKHRLIYLKQI